MVGIFFFKNNDFLFLKTYTDICSNYQITTRSFINSSLFTIFIIKYFEGKLMRTITVLSYKSQID